MSRMRGGWSRCRDVIGGHAFQPSRRDLRPGGEVPALKNAGLFSDVPVGQQTDRAGAHSNSGKALEVRSIAVPGEKPDF